MKKCYIMSVISIVICFTNSLKAQLVLHPFFSDRMVLQQNTMAAIYGFATKNTKVTLKTSWDKATYNTTTNNEGKWLLKIKTPTANYNKHSLQIKNEKTNITLNDILIGEVWMVSGQSNMEMPMKGFKDQPILNSNDDIFESANENISLFIVPRSVKLHPQDTVKNSSWKLATPESVCNFSATAYYFAKMIQRKLNVPVGILNITYGGSPVEAFMSKAALNNFTEIKLPTSQDSAKLNNKFATVLYNGMLKPAMQYTIKGCLWYQGESNYDRPEQYETLFPAFVQFLRTESNQGNFPFYYAQIAPYDYGILPGNENKKSSGYLREAQRRALAKIPNADMVVLLDAGEEKNIHPANKAVVGKRFAYQALGHTYNYKGFAYSSPTVDSILIKDTAIIVKFGKIPNGITSFGKPISNVEIAGEDKIFKAANTRIERSTLISYNALVPKPQYIRYAMKDYIVGELFSTEGLPVSSFTNHW